MLKEFKSDEYHYFIDDQGKRHGEYKRWYGNGQMTRHCFYVDDKRHGEAKRWNDDGTLIFHKFYVNGKFYRDISENPITDEDKFLISLETGGKWLC
jgi:antitoxin component YwqK of YwqJK toxin-antitoxin module